MINSVRPKSGGVDLDRLEEHFAARCRAVARIPYDPHLEEGAEVDLGELSGCPGRPCWSWPHTLPTRSRGSPAGRTVRATR